MNPVPNIDDVGPADLVAVGPVLLTSPLNQVDGFKIGILESYSCLIRGMPLPEPISNSVIDQTNESSLFGDFLVLPGT